MTNQTNWSVKCLSSRYTVRQMAREDVPAIYALCSGNPLFYQYCPPPVTEAGIHADLSMLPPGKTAQDKYYVGFYQADKLVAIMDLILRYPDEKTAWIGLFMVNPDEQGRGQGSFIIGELCTNLKTLGFAQVRLGYAKGNPQSEAFWKKNHFAKTGVEKQADGFTIVVMNRPL